LVTGQEELPVHILGLPNWERFCATSVLFFKQALSLAAPRASCFSDLQDLPVS
jgi:hypothetical protein